MKPLRKQNEGNSHQRPAHSLTSVPLHWSRRWLDSRRLRVTVNRFAALCLLLVPAHWTVTMADDEVDRSAHEHTIAAGSDNSTNAASTEKGKADTVEPSYRIDRDRVFARPDGFRLRADLFLPRADGPHPAVLLIHGGGWMGGSKAQMKWHAMRLASHGYFVMSINYRLAPKYKYPAQVDDCRTAFRWLCEHAETLNIDPARIGALGYSAGGHLACLMNVTSQAEDAHRLKVVVAGGAPCNFTIFPPDNNFMAYWLGGSRVEEPANYRNASPVFFATDDDAPTFFYHGEKDRIVPAFSSKSLQRCLSKQDVETAMYVCEGKGHVRAFMDHEAFQRSLAFLDEHLDWTASGRAAVSSADARTSQ